MKEILVHWEDRKNIEAERKASRVTLPSLSVVALERRVNTQKEVGTII